VALLLPALRERRVAQQVPANVNAG